MIDAAPRLRRAARLLRLATLASAVLLFSIAALGARLLIVGGRERFSAIRIEDQGLAPWPAALSILLIATLVVLALMRLARMLSRVEAGSPFGAARDLRGFATFLFLSVIASILAPPALQLALGGHEAQRLNLSMSMSDALMLLITGLMFFVARLLDEAQRVADDASQIV
jgi:hypothetical protein